MMYWGMGTEMQKRADALCDPAILQKAMRGGVLYSEVELLLTIEKPDGGVISNP